MFLFMADFTRSDCGSRPAGELLFCQQPQKSNQKKAAHIVCPAGSWILRYCLRARLDAPSGRTRLNSPSLANLLYQYRRIQQTKGGFQNKKRKNKTEQHKQKLVLKYMVRAFHCFWLCLSIHLSKPFSQYRYHGPSVPAVWACFASSGAAW